MSLRNTALKLFNKGVDFSTPVSMPINEETLYFLSLYQHTHTDAYIQVKSVDTHTTYTVTNMEEDGLRTFAQGYLSLKDLNDRNMIFIVQSPFTLGVFAREVS